MKKLLRNPKSTSFIFYLFLFGIFTFKIPNLYLVPGIYSPFLTIQSMGRISFGLVFAYHVLKALILNKSLIQKGDKQFIMPLIILLFFTQSLSIIEAQNMSAFFTRYKDILLGYLVFFNFYFYRSEFKKIALVFIISLPVNYIYQAIMIFNPPLFIDFFRSLIYNRHFELVEINIARGRTYMETFDEITIPFLFLFLQKKFTYLSILTGLNTLFSFASNWRTRVVMFLFSFLLSTLFFLKKNFLKMIVLAFIMLSFTLIVDQYLTHSYGFSFYDRILLSDASDISAITSRTDQIRNSIELAKEHFFGVGLGNYYDNLSFSEKKTEWINITNSRQSQIASEYVHNYFGLLLSESGFLSFGVFLLIVIFFIRNDWKIIQSHHQFHIAYVIAFWTLFIYASLNPLVPGTSQVLFWGIRGVLIAKT